MRLFINRLCLLCGVVLVLELSVVPAMLQGDDIFLTIYEGGFTLVQEARQLELKEGMNKVALDDLPWRIDPATVAVYCLSAPDKVAVHEKSFFTGLGDVYELLGERFIGARVRVVMKDGKVNEGVLADYTGEHVALMTDGGMLLINREFMSEVSIPGVEDDLPVKPTLILSLACEVDGPQRVELDYITDGIGWEAGYSLIERGENLSLKGWVAIENASGADYPESSFRLVSGGVRRAVPKEVVLMEGAELRGKAPEYAAGVRERSFSDYHVYDVDRKSSFKDGELKQIELFSAPDIKANKEYTYEGGGNARINYKFVNSTENGLGIPLPAGQLRVYRADTQGRLQFMGQDEVERSARGEEVRVYVGDAFDIVGERKQVETKHISRRSSEDTYEIELRNHKDDKVEITVVEKLSRHREWKIVSSSHEWKKKDAWRIEFPLSVDANSEAMLRYTVLYRW